MILEIPQLNHAHNRKLQPRSKAILWQDQIERSKSATQIDDLICSNRDHKIGAFLTRKFHPIDAFYNYHNQEMMKNSKNPPPGPMHFQLLQPLNGNPENPSYYDQTSLEKLILKSMNFMKWNRCKFEEKIDDERLRLVDTV
jgi:hypothetical protein